LRDAQLNLIHHRDAKIRGARFDQREHFHHVFIQRAQYSRSIQPLPELH